MFYYFINIIMYFIILLLLINYFKDKMNYISFLTILFYMNVVFILIYQNINFIYGIIIMLIMIVLYKLQLLFTKNNKEIILIKDGNINFHELINSYSYSKLIYYLKIRHIKIDEVAYCIMKNNQLIVIKNNLTDSLPINIVLDGKILENNLKLINKNKEWLQEELLKRHLLIKNIDYAYYRKNKIYFINN